MATLVEADPKAPFSITTTPRCVWGILLLSLDCSTLPLIPSLYWWVLSKEASSTLFWVFGMTQPGSLVNTLTVMPMSSIITSTKVRQVNNTTKFYQQNLFTNHIYLIYTYKKDLALNNLKWLICHKTKPNWTKPNQFTCLQIVYTYIHINWI